jgi:hypothetical protein
MLTALRMRFTLQMALRPPDEFSWMIRTGIIQPVVAY